MIDHLKSIAIFSSVADEASFRGAAQKLSLSPSVVSIHIKKLEEMVGAPLFYRSTRHVTLTDEGRVFYPSAKAMLSAARDGLDQFSDQASRQITELRVAVPDVLMSNPIATKLVEFAKSHTGIRLNIVASDRQQSVIGEGHDVAIRMGNFGDSDLKSKRIGEDKRVLVAAPSLLEKRAEPIIPDDLLKLDFVRFAIVPERVVLRRGETVSGNVWGKTVAVANSTLSVRAFCLGGMGIATLPFSMVEQDLIEQRLKAILPDWTDTQPLPVFLMWPSNADLGFAVRKFIQFMSKA